MDFRMISHSDASSFLLPRHYSGRIPSISFAFGWYDADKLMAVCTFGKPASPSLCKGVCGPEYSKYVYELNRLCREDDLLEPLSKFVSLCLHELSKYGHYVIISYSDTAMSHHGYIYQACNFLYTGMTKSRTDMYTPPGTHSRHYKAEDQKGVRRFRSAKHRYIYFVGSKTMRKQFRDHLQYPILPYPKGDQTNYRLGYVLADQYVERR